MSQIDCGLVRHRAIMYKVLSEAVGIRCSLIGSKKVGVGNDGTTAVVRLSFSKREEFVTYLNI